MAGSQPSRDNSLSLLPPRAALTCVNATPAITARLGRETFDCGGVMPDRVLVGQGGGASSPVALGLSARQRALSLCSPPTLSPASPLSLAERAH